MCRHTRPRVLVKRGDLEHIKSSIEIGDLDMALEVLEEILGLTE